MKAELPPENDLEAALDDALHTYPTLSPPPGFSDRVMVRVEATQGQRPIFSLSWLDYALSVLLLVMAAGTWLVWQILPPHVLAQVKLQILSLSLVYAQLAQIGRLHPILLLLAAMLLILAGLLLAGLLLIPKIRLLRS